MKKLTVLLAVLLLAAPWAWGASTRDNRADSLIYLGISPVGIHIPTLATMPVAVGMYLGSNVLVGVEYGSADIKVDNKKAEFGPYKRDLPDSQGDWRVDGSYENMGAFLKWFPGTNSLNVTLAAHKRTWDVDFDVTVRDDTNSFDIVGTSGLKADATVATVGLGNQWIMDFGLVVGLDWFYYSGLSGDSVEVKPITATALGTSYTPTAAERQRLEDELRDGGSTLNDASALPGILVLSLGWAF